MGSNKKKKSKKKPSNSSADQNCNEALQQNSRPPNQKGSEDRINTNVATNKEQKTAKNSRKTQQPDGMPNFQAFSPLQGM